MAFLNVVALLLVSQVFGRAQHSTKRVKMFLIPAAGHTQAAMLSLLLMAAPLACKAKTASLPGDAGPWVGVAESSVAVARVEELVDDSHPLPERTEVLRAVTGAIERAGARPEDAAVLFAAGRAAARVWRIEHNPQDARTALHVLADAAALAAFHALVPLACDAARMHAQLTAELARDPGVLYAELLVDSRAYGLAACNGNWSRELGLLAAFRPPPQVLRALDPRIAARRASVRDAGARPRPSASDAPSFALAGRLVAVEPYSGEDRARLVVTASAPVTYRVSNGLEAGLSLDFPDLELAAPTQITSSDGMVRSVRTMPGVGGRGTRVVVALAKRASRHVFDLPEPFRVVIDLAAEPERGSSANEPSRRAVRRVALDPGHGGTDPGAIGPGGLQEKDVTLAVAHLAAPLLSRELGVVTMLTRDDDRSVPLDARAARANAFHADLFISLHCNASENPGARGTMSFILNTSREEGAARVAARENAVSNGVSVDVAAIAAGLRSAETSAPASLLASLLQRAATSLAADGVPDLGVKTAGFFVLLGAEMPSVLFETAFISNPMEENRLASNEFRQKLAYAVLEAVRAYQRAQ